jgi:hypothetical protein
VLACFNSLWPNLILAVAQFGYQLALKLPQHVPAPFGLCRQVVLEPLFRSAMAQEPTLSGLIVEILAREARD